MRKNAREGSRLEDDGAAADCRYSGRFNAHTRRIEGKREREREKGRGGGGKEGTCLMSFAQTRSECNLRGSCHFTSR